MEKQVSKDINLVHLRGRLGRDIETKKAHHSGKSYCYLNIATGGWKKKDGSQTATIWHNCVVFGELADFLHGIAKGEWVEIEGRIEHKEHKIAGVKYAINEAQIIVEKVLDPSYDEYKSGAGSSPEEQEEEIDTCPF